MTGTPATAGSYRAIRRFQAWVWDDALPFWSSVGVDPKGFGFVEHLGLDGGLADVAFKRLRVQARQLYVYSHASLMGWEQGIDAAKIAFDFLLRHGRGKDGGWVRLLDAQGGIKDPTADLYDIAFVLFGLAWYGRATGSAAPTDLARETLGWVEQRMRSPTGGFVNALPADGPRQQNPHMHLLEATLALFETTGDPHFRGLADELVGLFRRHFIDPVTGTLGEFFQEDLSAAPGEAGDQVEPGHQYEWVWLLDQYARLTGGERLPDAMRLYGFANAHGLQPGTGLAVASVDRSGRVRDGSTRIWPQTEAIKAHLATGNLDAAERAADGLMRRFLERNPPGTWNDHLDAAGNLHTDRIPTSSLYHIFVAYAETVRILGKAG